MTVTEQPGAHEPATVRRARVAVLGTGAIGRDLIHKIHNSPVLDCALVAGRSPQSDGLRLAADLGYSTDTGGIEAVLAAPEPFDVVFDATNALSHARHWQLLEPSGTLLVDLTPSRLGQPVVPSVTGTRSPTGRNVSMISCGGQASIPVAHALASRFPTTYLEVVSTVASDIAGRATRLNVDEYVVTTQHAIELFTGVRDTKVILTVSPATPPATFRTTIHAVVPGAADHARAIDTVVAETGRRVRTSAPGFDVVACVVRDDRVVVSLEVLTHSAVLPRYAGNLDIINSAALLVAEQHAYRLAAATAPEVRR